MVERAVEIAWRYQRDRRYIPSQEELILFDRLEAVLFTQYMAGGYIVRCMRARTSGRKEDVARFTNMLRTLRFTHSDGPQPQPAERQSATDEPGRG